MSKLCSFFTWSTVLQNPAPGVLANARSCSVFYAKFEDPTLCVQSYKNQNKGVQFNKILTNFNVSDTHHSNFFHVFL